MDIQFYGANCITVATKQVRFVIDDNLAELGAKPVTHAGDIALFTYPHPAAVPQAKLTIDMPGEYESHNVTVHGMQSRAHMDSEDERSATMYKIIVGDTRVLVTGHIFPKLSETKLEDIGLVDIMVIPVGGNGFTLDPTGAAQIIRQVEPKFVVLTHYADKDLRYEVPQQSFDDAVKAIAIQPRDSVKKFTFKPADANDTTQLVVLEKSA